MSLRAFIYRLAALVLLVSAFATQAAAGQRVALVIGNASYAHAPALANPLNDASDIGAALERLGFAVTRLENADQAALRRGLQAFALAASASEVAVVFYAGHGIEVDQRNFLVPVDARLASDRDVEFETVPLELVSRAVERASGLRLVILDACRENPFAASMQRAGATRSIGRGLARIEPSGETLVAYAAKEGTVASDGDGRNSPYSGALLAHLEEPGLEVGLLFRKVRDTVLASTGGRQEPFVYGSLSSRGAYLGVRPDSAPVTGPGPDDTEPARENTGRLVVQRLALEQSFWESVKDSADVADIHAYLDKYPNGHYEVLARNRLRQLSSASEEDAPQAAAVPTAASQGSSAAPAPAHPESLEASLGLKRPERGRIQQGLTALGFDPGPADGLFGRGTRGAIGKWQLSRGVMVTGYLDAEAAKTLLAAAGAEAGASGEASRDERLAAEREFWVSVKGSKDPSDFDAYMEAYPGGVYAKLAHRWRDELIASDDASYERARSSGTVESYGEYLRSYPAGRHVAEARGAAAEAERLAREREHEPGRVFRDCDACPEMVVVPAGSFMMGSPSSEEGRDDDEGPVHRVTIPAAFAVGKYEVTFSEWEACVAGGGCDGHRPGDGGWGRGQRPVIDVTWKDARSYVGWLSRKTGKQYRLLSEAEWEYSARAGTTGPFHFGSTISTDQANYDGDGTYGSGREGVDRRKTVPVGSFPANGFGLHDMHGNVWEWVEDCRHDSYLGTPSDGSAWTTGGECSKRVLRGGSWINVPRVLRSADRNWSSTGNRYISVGFRVSRTLTP